MLSDIFRILLFIQSTDLFCGQIVSINHDIIHKARKSSIPVIDADINILILSIQNIGRIPD